MNILTEISKDKNIQEGFRTFFAPITVEQQRITEQNDYENFCNRLHKQVGMKCEPTDDQKGDWQLEANKDAYEEDMRRRDIVDGIRPDEGEYE